MASIGAGQTLKADFGAGRHAGAPIGIPFVVVPHNQQQAPIQFSRFADEEPVADESVYVRYEPDADSDTS